MSRSKVCNFWVIPLKTVPEAGALWKPHLGAGRVVPWVLEHSSWGWDVREKQSSTLFKWLYFGVFTAAFSEN